MPKEDYDAEKNEYHLKSSAKIMQSDGWPFKSQLLCAVHSALNCGTKGLNTCTLLAANM